MSTGSRRHRRSGRPRLIRPLSAGLLLLTVLFGLAMFGSGARLTTQPRRAQAQTPSTPQDDEQWVSDQANQICDAYENQNPDIGCDSSEPYKQPLRDCLQFVAANSNVDNRSTCQSYVRNSEAFAIHPRTRFDGDGLSAALDAAVAAETARYSGLSLGDDLLAPFKAALRSCLAGDLRSDSFRTPRSVCGDAYKPLDAAVSTALLQQLDADLLAHGLGAADMLSLHNQVADCAKQQILLGITDTAAIYSSCLTDLGIVLKPATPPSITSLTCDSSAPVGQVVHCAVSVVSSAGAFQWSAPGGSPNAATDAAGTGDVFSTSYSNDGQKTIELTACNHVVASALTPAHDECAFQSATVTVTPVAPVIGAFGCSPTTVQPGAVVTCHGDVLNATGSTTRRWSSQGGDPVQGSGPDYTVTFASAGVHTILFTGCNGSACDGRAIGITVQPATTTAPAATPTPVAAVPAARPVNLTGTWDANNGVWTFTQSGNNVTASIVFSGGLGSAHLQGTISNGTVQATYQCNSDCQIADHGTVSLALSSNGCTMQGTYTNSLHDTGPLTMTKRGCSG